MRSFSFSGFIARSKPLPPPPSPPPPPPHPHNLLPPSHPPMRGEHLRPPGAHCRRTKRAVLRVLVQATVGRFGRAGSCGGMGGGRRGMLLGDIARLYRTTCIYIDGGNHCRVGTQFFRTGSPTPAAPACPTPTHPTHVPYTTRLPSPPHPAHPIPHHYTLRCRLRVPRATAFTLLRTAPLLPLLYHHRQRTYSRFSPAPLPATLRPHLPTAPRAGKKERDG